LTDIIIKATEDSGGIREYYCFKLWRAFKPRDML